MVSEASSRQLITLALRHSVSAIAPSAQEHTSLFDCEAPAPHSCRTRLILYSPACQVVEWVLAPVRAVWSAPDWPGHLASPRAFYAHYVDIQQDAQGRPQVCPITRCVQPLPFCQCASYAPSAVLCAGQRLQSSPVRGAPQAGGRLARQELYHEMHLIERTIRAFTKPPAALERASLQPGHPIVPHLAWALPVVLQVPLILAP